ncbi:MAG: arylsulfatase [Planctomycetales bacterium]|nr:arylsulfatase [Planctomycetales bacterium]
MSYKKLGFASHIVLPIVTVLGLLATLQAGRAQSPKDSATDSPPSRPNIVFILCDDLGIGDVHVFNPQRGKILTPYLDQLARDGMRFTDAHSSSAVCTPSRYSILTGRYCWRSRLQSGVLGGESAPLLASNRLTVAEFLQRQGYATACLGKWHLGLEFGARKFVDPILNGPLQHGFDSFFGISASLDMPPFAWIDGNRFTEEPTATKTWLREGPAGPSFEAIDVLPTLTRKACEFIRSKADQEGSPYFLYLAYASPHTPIVPTPEWRGKSGLGEYADFVMQTDACIGEVLQAIDDAGQRDNTLVVFTSDNGFAPAADPQALERQGHFPSAGYRGYKADIWEGGHRVPMIARWPGRVAADSECSQLVGLVDFFATVGDLLELPIPGDSAEDSESFLPALEGRSEPRRKTQLFHSINGRFAVRDGSWKLELCPGSGGWGAPRDAQAVKQQLPPWQLYDLSVDPREQTNRYADRPEIVDRLGKLLETAVDQGRTTEGEPKPNDVTVAIELPAK